MKIRRRRKATRTIKHILPWQDLGDRLFPLIGKGGWEAPDTFTLSVPPSRKSVTLTAKIKMNGLLVTSTRRFKNVPIMAIEVAAYEPKTFIGLVLQAEAEAEQKAGAE